MALFFIQDLTKLIKTYYIAQHAVQHSNTVSYYHIMTFTLHNTGNNNRTHIFAKFRNAHAGENLTVKQVKTSS